MLTKEEVEVEEENNDRVEVDAEDHWGVPRENKNICFRFLNVGLAKEE
jgi:hypothetical protein